MHSPPTSPLSTLRLVGRLLCLALPSLAMAQDDMRDVLRLRNGKEVRGRLAQPFLAGDLVVLQGGKRVRIPPGDVAGSDLVADRIREFFDRRARLRGNARGQWLLVEWADSRELVDLARLQAMRLALDTDDERAHRYLEHRQRNGRWLWAREGRHYPLQALQAQLVKDPITLHGERFQLRCDGELGPNLDALFDLERMGVWWYDTFGPDLLFDEMLQPALVFAHRDAVDFPKWGFRPIPYFAPEPHGDIGHTFWSGASPVRPRDLFFVGSQALLYRALIGNGAIRDERDRVVPWLEIGLPMLAETTMGGDAGYAAPGTPQKGDLQALQALGRGYRLTHLLHLPMYGGFYLMDDTPTAVNWSAAATFVLYLLRPDNAPPTRERFLAYVRAALGERKGDSSSLFDAMMGLRVEELEAPLREWLEKQAGH